MRDYIFNDDTPVQWRAGQQFKPLAFAGGGDRFDTEGCRGVQDLTWTKRLEYQPQGLKPPSDPTWI